MKVEGTKKKKTTEKRAAKVDVRDDVAAESIKANHHIHSISIHFQPSTDSPIVINYYTSELACRLVPSYLTLAYAMFLT